MQTCSSANSTCSEFSSASEYTATVLMPSSRQAWMTRSAISPRFAIRIFLNMAHPPQGGVTTSLCGFYREQPLAVLHGVAVLHVDLDDLAVALRLDLVHQLHRFDDAEDLTLTYRLSCFDEGLRTWLRRSVDRADEGRLDDGEVDVLLGRRQPWRRGRRRRSNRTAAWGHRRRRTIGHLRQGRHGGGPGAATALPEPQLHVVTFELEFGDVVLAHQFEDEANLVQIHR